MYMYMYTHCSKVSPVWHESIDLCPRIVGLNRFIRVTLIVGGAGQLIIGSLSLNFWWIQWECCLRQSVTVKSKLATLQHCVCCVIYLAGQGVDGTCSSDDSAACILEDTCSNNKHTCTH